MKTPANITFQELARVAAEASHKANGEARAAGVKVAVKKEAIVAAVTIDDLARDGGVEKANRSRVLSRKKQETM
jgi:hypothetical protein